MMTIAKNFICILSFICLFVSNFIHAQTASQVIDDYLNAIGGKNKILAINSLQYTSVNLYRSYPSGESINLNSFSPQKPTYSFIYAKPFCKRHDAEDISFLVTKDSIYYVKFKGEKAFSDSKNVRMTVFRYPLGALDAVLEFLPLLKKEGSYKGKVNVKEEECYWIECQGIDFYFSVKKKLLVKKVLGLQKETEIYYTDYQRNDDFLLATLTSTYKNQKLVSKVQFKDIRLNVPINDSFFTLNEFNKGK